MLDAIATQQTLDAGPFGPWWGFEVEWVDTGRSRVRLPDRPELFRTGGVLQGGCAMTLADVAFWVAIMGTVDAGEAAVTLEQTSTFLGGTNRSGLRGRTHPHADRCCPHSPSPVPPS